MIPAVKKSAAIYVRVSSDDQVDNTSLETQETACRRWCAQQGSPTGSIPEPDWGKLRLRLQAIGEVA